MNSISRNRNSKVSKHSSNYYQVKWQDESKAVNPIETKPEKRKEKKIIQGIGSKAGRESDLPKNGIGLLVMNLADAIEAGESAANPNGEGSRGSGGTRRNLADISPAFGSCRLLSEGLRAGNEKHVVGSVVSFVCEEEGRTKKEGVLCWG